MRTLFGAVGLDWMQIVCMRCEHTERAIPSTRQWSIVNWDRNLIRNLCKQKCPLCVNSSACVVIWALNKHLKKHYFPMNKQLFQGICSIIDKVLLSHHVPPTPPTLPRVQFDQSASKCVISIKSTCTMHETHSWQFCLLLDYHLPTSVTHQVINLLAIGHYFGAKLHILVFLMI